MCLMISCLFSTLLLTKCRSIARCFILFWFWCKCVIYLLYCQLNGNEVITPMHTWFIHLNPKHEYWSYPVQLRSIKCNWSVFWFCAWTSHCFLFLGVPWYWLSDVGQLHVEGLNCAHCSNRATINGN